MCQASAYFSGCNLSPDGKVPDEHTPRIGGVASRYSYGCTVISEIYFLALALLKWMQADNCEDTPTTHAASTDGWAPDAPDGWQPAACNLLDGLRREAPHRRWHAAGSSFVVRVTSRATARCLFVSQASCLV